jgi:hypothetical protein
VLLLSHVVGSLNGEFPLAPNSLIPYIPATQLALIEPDLNAGGPQSFANPVRSCPILRGVTQEYGA